MLKIRTILLVSWGLITTCQGFAQRDARVVKWYADAVAITPDEAMITFTAYLQEGWYLSSPYHRKGGPLPTTFTFFNNPKHSLLGSLKEEKNPELLYSDKFGMAFKCFSRVAVFTQHVKLVAHESAVCGKIEFMACAIGQCLPPDVFEFNVPVRGVDTAADNNTLTSFRY